MERWRWFSAIVVAVIALVLLALFGLAVYCAAKTIPIAMDANKSIKEMTDQEKREHAPEVTGKNSGNTFTLPSDTDSKEAESQKEDAYQDRKSVMFQQINRLMDLGFDAEAGLSREEFVSLVTVPRSADALLIVNENCISIAKQCELLGVRQSLDMSKHNNAEKLPLAKFYWVYDVDAGWGASGVSVLESRRMFHNNGRRAATTVEILALYRQDSKLLNALMIDAAGSTYGAGRNPYLWLNDGVPELAAGLSGHSHREAASPSFKSLKN